jgi:hypothetical protein
MTTELAEATAMPHSGGQTPSLMDIRTAIAADAYDDADVATMLEWYQNSHYDMADIYSTPNGIHVEFPPASSSPEAATTGEPFLSVYFEGLADPKTDDPTVCSVGVAELRVLGSDGRWYREGGYELKACDRLHTVLKSRHQTSVGQTPLEYLLEQYLARYDHDPR